MLPKLDTFVLLTNEGPGMDKRDEHWSKTKHGDDGMCKGNKNRVASDDFRTLKPLSATHGPQHISYKHQKLVATPGQRSRRLISREGHLSIPMHGSSCSWITNTELSS